MPRRRIKYVFFQAFSPDLPAQLIALYSLFSSLFQLNFLSLSHVPFLSLNPRSPCPGVHIVSPPSGMQESIPGVPAAMVISCVGSSRRGEDESGQCLLLPGDAPGLQMQGGERADKGNFPMLDCPWLTPEAWKINHFFVLSFLVFSHVYHSPLLVWPSGLEQLGPGAERQCPGAGPGLTLLQGLGPAWFPSQSDFLAVHKDKPMWGQGRGRS